MPLHACTIVARNYLPHARVVAMSFLQQHPGARFTTLVIDDRDHEVDAEPFEIVRLQELIHDVNELHLLATYYDVMELATAVKPLLLSHLLAAGATQVIYLDPDIEVYAPLTTVEVAATEHAIVLTPHTTVPIPRDGLRPSEAEIMGSGIYNLGFLAVAPGAEPFLDWWWERLRRDAVVDLARMLFTDQRWIDFVPGLFDHQILKDPGLNVAYWNLHGRDVQRTAAGFEVNGQPLRFFHFSGYSPFRPHVLSKHQGDHPRVRLVDAPAVAELAAAYGEKLVQAGLIESGGPAYGWSGEQGFVLDRAMRRAYQHAVRQNDLTGRALPPDPFSGDGGAAFQDWLQTRDPRWRRLSRYLAATHELRPDLQAGFPAGARGTERKLARWAQYGGLGGHTPSALRGLPAVQAVGYFRAELGMGEHGRQLVETLQAAGADVSTTTWTETISRQQHSFAELRGATAPQVNLLIVNADQTPVFAQAAGRHFFRNRYTVGAWAWELDEFPPYNEAFDVVDEVWAGSEFARDAIAQRTSKPVYAVPPPVTVAPVDSAISRRSLGLPGGYLFLFAFDYLSVPKRKNPLGLVDAFCAAFAPGEGPTLVLKTINGDKLPDARATLRAAAAERPDILLIEHYLSASERTALMGHADCYVSLHRSEGFGLTMAEAMGLGKPVIATGYSGNLTFMDEGNSYLVPFRRVRVGPDAAPYAADAHWAEPDLDAAASLMRQVWADPAAAALIGARAAHDIAAKHSPQARAELVTARLEGISHRLPGGLDRARPSTPAEFSLTPLQRRLNRARFVLYVARTSELRRAALRRRMPAAMSDALARARRGAVTRRGGRAL